jgi:hypothetical protein
MGEEQCTICSLVGERYYRTQKVKPWRWSLGPFMTRVDQACHSMGGSFYSATVSTERSFYIKRILITRKTNLGAMPQDFDLAVIQGKRNRAMKWKLPFNVTNFGVMEWKSYNLSLL